MSVPFDVWLVKEVIKDTLTAIASPDGDEASLADLKESHVAENSGLEKLLASSEEKLVNAERRIQAFELSKNLPDDMSSRVNEAEAKLKASEKPVRFLEDKVSEKSNHLVRKDASTSRFLERFVDLEK